MRDSVGSTILKNIPTSSSGDTFVVEDRDLLGKKRELNYVHAALESNGYPSKFIKNIHVKRSRSSTTNVSPEELVGMFFKMVLFFKHFSQRSFLDFNYVSSWLRPFNIFTFFFCYRTLIDTVNKHNRTGGFFVIC